MTRRARWVLTAKGRAYGLRTRKRARLVLVNWWAGRRS